MPYFFNVGEFMRKALVVGINKYPDVPLDCCVNDAKAVAKLLKTNEDGSDNFEVVLALDVMKKTELMSHIKELFSNDSEIALLYFSGHGH